MRKFLWLSGVACVALGVAVASSATAPSDPGGPFCRRAPELVQLPAEQPVPIPQQQTYGGAVGDSMASTPPVLAAPPPPPSPPPPPPMPERGGEIMVTGSRVDSARTARPEAAPPAPPPPATMSSPRAASTVADGRYERRNAPPAGLLTAGDHDDLLNPMLYARYVARAVRALGQQIGGLPKVDTRRSLTIAVEDASGRGAPFVPVTISCSDGNSLTLSTLADGRVVLFPALDRLSSRVRITAGGVSRNVDIGDGAGGQVQTLVAHSPAQVVRKFDLMIALDSTGSMGDEIEFLKSELQSILGDIGRAYPGLDIRVGLVAYRDIGDDYVTRTDRLGSAIGTIQNALDRTWGMGGGDMPEAMDQALIRAIGQDWRADAVKSLLLVADAPPHDDLQGKAFAAAEAARARRIQIVPVAASGVDDRAEYFMRAVAAATQSRYIFLTDDSGIGNPHAEPDVDCYVVTQLAGAIRRVLASQISGQRVEPYPEEVVRTSGRYNHGRCILPADFRVQ